MAALLNKMLMGQKGPARLDKIIDLGGVGNVARDVVQPVTIRPAQFHELLRGLAREICGGAASALREVRSGCGQAYSAGCTGQQRMPVREPLVHL
jgi:hypothetical protein